MGVGDPYGELKAKRIAIDLGNYKNHIIECYEDQDGDNVYFQLKSSYNFMNADTLIAKQIRYLMAEFDKLLYDTQSTFNAIDTTHRIKFTLVIDYEAPDDYEKARLLDKNMNEEGKKRMPVYGTNTGDMID